MGPSHTKKFEDVLFSNCYKQQVWVLKGDSYFGITRTTKIKKIMNPMIPYVWLCVCQLQNHLFPKEKRVPLLWGYHCTRTPVDSYIIFRFFIFFWSLLYSSCTAWNASWVYQSDRRYCWLVKQGGGIHRNPRVTSLSKVRPIWSMVYNCKRGPGLSAS